ncbi:MAG: 2'-5' RNA ligase family protein [Patescibacteria group bacterium]
MTQRWFIALIPEKPQHEAIVRFSAQLRERIPGIVPPHTEPHVTIIPPFVCDKEQAEAALKEMVVAPAFQVQTIGFGHFSNHHCWYISLEQHRYFATLEQLGRSALGPMAPKTYGKRIYHITVAQGVINDESNVMLGNYLQQSSPPCTQVRFKHLYLVRKLDNSPTLSADSYELKTAL